MHRHRHCRSQRFDQSLDDKPAVSNARRIDFDADKGWSLLEVGIETGRKHQIRRHLAGAGYPVVGDKLHGTDTQEELRLTAVRLEFAHPDTGETMLYQLPTEIGSGTGSGTA